MVSDHWQMGRIAALHALSDLYACGAWPVSTLAAVTLPFASNALLQRELQQLLGGALHEFAVADCRLNGGHTMQGPELSLGFVVNGIPMSPDGKLLRKTGAVPGDQLVLTKPLGTGTVFAAHMQLAADGRDVSAALSSMLQSNAIAAELALAHGASACTDITGFGLLGHLLEMLDGALGVTLELAALPLLPGALLLSQQGIVSTMHAANARSGGSYLQAGPRIDVARLQMLFDPQTSGGLLIALPGERASTLCAALHQAGYVAAAIIGEVTALATTSAPPVLAT
jgi:selenide,water dikinase